MSVLAAAAPSASVLGAADAATTAASMDTDTVTAELPPPMPTPTRAASTKGRGSRGAGGAAGNRRAAAAAAAALQQSPADAARAAARWSSDEHAVLISSVWRFGLTSVVRSVSPMGTNAPAEIPAGSDDGFRILQPHAHSLSAVSSKSPAQMDLYTRMLVFDMVSSYLYVAPLLDAAAVRGHRLNASFLAELLRTHELTAPDRDDPSCPELARPLAIPPSEAEGGAATTAAAQEHEVLVRWVSRLRRLFLLNQLASSSDLDAAALAAILQERIGLRYDADALELLPRAGWIAMDDARLLLSAREHGYGAQLPADSASPQLQLLRLDFVLDAFHASLIQQQDRVSVEPVPVLPQAPSDPDAEASPWAPPSSTTPVWTSALIRSVIDVLTTHGVPVQSFIAAAAAASAASTPSAETTADPATTAAAAASGTAESFVCPACPLLDWPALYELLSAHTGVSFDARWQKAISALLGHVSIQCEDVGQTSLRGQHTSRSIVDESLASFAAQLSSGSMPPPSDLSSSALLLPAETLQAFRRSVLFFHLLRVRILDASFHGFASGIELITWVSQYAHGLDAPAAAAAAGETAAPTTDDGGNVPTPGSALISGVRTSSCDCDSGESLFASAPGAPGMADSADASGAESPMPSWWQIGMHDLCLLSSVDTWGADLDERFWTRINEDIARGGAAGANAEASAAAVDAQDTLSALHWTDSSLWATHSRPIIRRRMGAVPPDQPLTEEEMNDEPMPAVTAIEKKHHRALVKRMQVLVTTLGAIATEEFLNRLSQCLQPAAAAEASSGETNFTSPCVSFGLNAAGATSLHYFQASLVGYSFQPSLVETLQIKAGIPLPSSSSTTAATTRKRNRWTLSSVLAPSVPILSEGAPGEQNPFKHADATFLRPESSSLSRLREGFKGAAWKDVRDAAFVTVQRDGKGKIKQGMEEDGVAKAESSLDDVPMDAEPSTDVGGSTSAESGVLSTLLAHRRSRAESFNLIESLFGSANLLAPRSGDDGTPAAVRRTVPILVQVTPDAHLVVPQQVEDGCVLHKLGELSAESLAFSKRVHLAHSSKGVKREGTEEDAAGSTVLILLPVGYASTVRHQSYFRADSLADYLCEILPSSRQSKTGKEGGIVCRVTASDDLAHAVEGDSPQEVWEAVTRRIVQHQCESEDASIVPVNGLEQFGLRSPVVLHALAAEVYASTELQEAITTIFSAEEVMLYQQSVARLDPVQFYALDPVVLPAHHGSLRRALEAEWSHHFLRLERLNQSILQKDRARVDRARAAAAAQAKLVEEQHVQAQQQQQVAAAQARAAQVAALAAASVSPYAVPAHQALHSQQVLAAQAQAQAQAHAAAAQAQAHAAHPAYAQYATATPAAHAQYALQAAQPQPYAVHVLSPQQAYAHVAHEATSPAHMYAMQQQAQLAYMQQAQQQQQQQQQHAGYMQQMHMQP